MLYILLGDRITEINTTITDDDKHNLNEFRFILKQIGNTDKYVYMNGKKVEKNTLEELSTGPKDESKYMLFGKKCYPYRFIEQLTKDKIKEIFTKDLDENLKKEISDSLIKLISTLNEKLFVKKEKKNVQQKQIETKMTILC